MFLEKIGSLRNLSVMAVFLAIAMFAMVGQAPKTASAQVPNIPEGATHVTFCHVAESGNVILMENRPIANLSGHFDAQGNPLHAGDFIIQFETARGVRVGAVVNVATDCIRAGTATLIIDKVCVPATTTATFQFALTGVTGLGTRTIDCDDPNVRFANIPVVAAGTAVTLTETAVAPTVLAGFTTTISCVLTGTTTVVGTPSTIANISLTLTPGQSVTCTVTNTRLGTVNVTKVCEPGATGTFVVTLGTLAARNLACGETTTFANVALTTTGVTLTETARAGLNTAIICGTTVRQAGDITFNVAAGQVINCFVINFVAPVAPFQLVLIDGRVVVFDGVRLFVDNVLIAAIDLDVDVDTDVDVDVDTDVDVDVDNKNENTNVSSSHSVAVANVTVVVPEHHHVVGTAGQQQQQQQQAAVVAPVVSTAGVIAPPRTGDAGLVSENAGGSSIGLLALAIVAVGGTVLVGATLYKRSLS